MLHTISNLSSSTVDTTLISNHDAVLFWQNGVNLTLKNNIILNAIFKKTSRCYALVDDILARGLSDFIDPRVEIIDMHQVVQLTINDYPQLKW